MTKTMLILLLWTTPATLGAGPTSRGVAPSGRPAVDDVRPPTNPGLPPFTPEFAKLKQVPAGLEARAYAYQYTVAPSFFYGGWGGYSSYGGFGYGRAGYRGGGSFGFSNSFNYR